MWRASSSSAVRLTVAQLFVGAGILLAGIGVGRLLTSTASAHQASNYFTTEWKNDTSIKWAFTHDFEDAVPLNGEQAVHSEFMDWGALPPQIGFDKVATHKPEENAGVCKEVNYEDNFVRWGAIDGKEGSVLAYEVGCLFGDDHSRRFSSDIVFDKDENWHYDSSTSPTDNEYDMAGVASHEIGHFLGFAGHFDATEPVPICENSPKHTMCRTVPSGTTYQRTLEEHDVHTFDNAYP